jgi:hypothetical protein
MDEAITSLQQHTIAIFPLPELQAPAITGETGKPVGEIARLKPQERRHAIDLPGTYVHEATNAAALPAPHAGSLLSLCPLQR